MNRRNILQVYRRDIKNTLKNPIALIIILAICVIPALYAWVNIIACWDIYENTGSIPVAVINNDETVLFNDDYVNIGDDVVEELEKNDKIKWTFVDEEEANSGLVEGRYYASIEIPETFSDDFLSVLTEDPHKPKIIYKVDTKSNPVAVKITDTAKNTLVQQIKGNFVATVNETIFKSLNTLGEDADTKKEDLIKLKGAIVLVNRNIDFLDKTLENIHTGALNYEGFMNEMHALQPSVQESIKVLERNNQNKGDLLVSSQIVINKAMDGLESNLNSAVQSNNQIHDLLAELNDSRQEKSENTVNKTVLNLTYQIQALDTTIDATTDYLDVLKSIDFNDELDATSKRLLDLQTSLSGFESQLKVLEDALSGVSGSMGSVSDSLAGQIRDIEKSTENIEDALGQSIAQLESINESVNSPVLEAAANQLKAVQSSQVLDRLSGGLSTLKGAQDDIQGQVDSVNGRVADVVSAIDGINKEIDNVVKFSNGTIAGNDDRNERVDDVSDDLEDVQKSLENQQEQIEAIQESLQNSNEISSDMLKDMNDTVTRTSTQLLTVQRKFTSSARKDVNAIIGNSITSAQNSTLLIESLKDLNDYMTASVGSASEGGQMTADFASDLKTMLNDVRDTLSLMGEHLEMVDNRDISLIISLLQSNPEFMGDFMSNPFDLQTETINAIPNYGSSMAPVYSTLALWVGCLFLNSVLKAHPGEFEGSRSMTVRERHFGKMLYFCTLAALQGAIIAVGDIWLLKIHVVNAPLFIVFAVLSSIVFSTITFTLMATLSNFGKALAIIYMILQLAGSGGTYPIQVDPLIFRILQPLFPFTYSVNGFREAIAGPLVVNVFLNIIALLIFAAVFNIFGYLTVETLHPKVRKFEMKLKESGLGE